MKKSELKNIIKEVINEEKTNLIEPSEWFKELKSNFPSILEKYYQSIEDVEDKISFKDWVVDFSSWFNDNGKSWFK